MSDKHDKSKSKRDPAKDTDLRREARRQRAIERLGTTNPSCVRCDENDPLVLELHHIPGQAFGELPRHRVPKLPSQAE